MSVIKQKVCGLLGGLAYPSTLEYYKYMNELVGQYFPGHNSEIAMVSIDLPAFLDFLNDNEWDKAAEYVLMGVERLIKADIDFLLICSNTGHMASDLIQKCYPKLPFIHIGDTSAYAIKKAHFKKVGFLGTLYSMSEKSSVVQRLLAHGIAVIFPYTDDAIKIHNIIIEELSKNIFTKKSKEFYLDVIQNLRDEHDVEGVVLGCTEIPLLVNQIDVPSIPLFDTTRIHAAFAVEYQLGRVSLDFDNN